MESVLKFKRISKQDMELLIPYFKYESGQSCDVSYGGILMWADLYDYEYAIYRNTLFIKGQRSDGTGHTVFYRPLGQLDLKEGVEILRSYCASEGIDLEFHPIPEYSISEFTALNPKCVCELSDLGDYIYDAESLATLKGKKMSKKRNHVNQFQNLYPDWSYERLSCENVGELLEEMDEIEQEASQNKAARIERELCRKFLREYDCGNENVKGGILRVGGKVAAFAIGDVRGDTLFVQIEKASRQISGAYEMINKLFASDMLESYPELKYINREEDAGDPGLRKAKESYHPVKILRKYSVVL